MVCLHSSTPSFRLASAGKPRPRPREASHSRTQPRSLLHGVLRSSPPLRSCRVCCRRRHHHGSVSDGPRAAGELSESARRAEPPPTSPGHRGRLSPASWRPGPPGSPLPPARAPELPGSRACPAASHFPGTQPSAPRNAQAPGGSQLLERVRGGGQAWPRESRPDSEGRGLHGRRLRLQGLLPSVGDGDPGTVISW